MKHETVLFVLMVVAAFCGCCFGEKNHVVLLSDHALYSES